MKRFLQGLVGLGVGYGCYDYFSKDQIMTRNIRTLICGIQIFYQYKIRFNPNNIEDVHETAAKSLYKMCILNDGTYVKFGQQVAASDHILPPSYLKYFASMQDKAKPAPYEDIEKIIKEEFHQNIEDLFQKFDRVPIASASIAQVHKAQLKTGEIVAVKIQKPTVSHQFKYDLKMSKLFFYAMEKIFDIPLTQFNKSLEENLIKELDFVNESRNAEICREFFQKTNRKEVYIPIIYNQFSTKRVLTMEWVDGIKITDTQQLKAQKYNISQVMASIVEAFAEQIFVTGFIHCDPHPGNIYVRRNPQQKKKHQIILFDFGLCISLTNQLRKTYCKLWESIFLQNQSELKKIVREWGMEDDQSFVSYTLMRPVNSKAPISKGYTKQDIYELQLKLKQDLRKILGDTTKYPSELLYIQKNMNLVRSINKYLGSPVNRINILAKYSVQGQQESYQHTKKFFKKNSFQTRLLIQSLTYSFIESCLKLFQKKSIEQKFDDKIKEITDAQYARYGMKPVTIDTFLA